MDITNTTVYTKERVVGFQRFNARLIKSVPWSTYFIFFLLFAMLLMGLVFSIMMKMWVITGVVALGIAIFARRFYFLYIAPARKFDASSFKNVEQSYVFRKVGFSVTSKGEETKRRYEEIYRAYATGKDFYLYFNKGMAFIVDRNGFTEGSEAKLTELLGEKLGSRFKSVKK